jgi:hypothetical protein
MDSPAEEPDVVPKKRRFLSRAGHQQLTPEQREEAERLRKLAAKYGTPTAIVDECRVFARPVSGFGAESSGAYD